MQPGYRRPRWQLLMLLLAAAALFGYDRTLDRTQDVFRPPELDVLGASASHCLCPPVTSRRLTFGASFVLSVECLPLQLFLGIVSGWTNAHIIGQANGQSLNTAWSNQVSDPVSTQAWRSSPAASTGQPSGRSTSTFSRG